MILEFLFWKGAQFDLSRLAEIMMNISVISYRFKEQCSLSVDFCADTTIKVKVSMGVKSSEGWLSKNLIQDMELMVGVRQNI